jgi:crossover junction endodeoxyribonuclease RuvC
LKIVGIDPGSQVAGFAVIEAAIPMPMSARHYRILDVGVWRFQKGTDHGGRIAALHQVAYELLVQHGPMICVLEKAFGGVNISSALKLGEARGAVVAAASRTGTLLHQVNPTQAKKSVTGNGHASKEDIALSLKLLMGFDRGKLPHDASDALCLALSYALTIGLGGGAGMIARADLLQKGRL